jgi:hypothetical protein
MFPSDLESWPDEMRGTMQPAKLPNRGKPKCGNSVEFSTPLRDRKQAADHTRSTVATGGLRAGPLKGLSWTDAMGPAGPTLGTAIIACRTCSTHGKTLKRGCATPSTSECTVSVESSDLEPALAAGAGNENCEDVSPDKPSQAKKRRLGRW